MSLFDPDPPLSSVRARLDRTLLRARRAVLRRRRLLAAGLVAVAVWAGLSATASPAPQTVPVLVAVRDLPAGTTLATGDVVSVGFRPDTAPSDVVADPAAVAGRLLAAPVTAGEPITAVRLVGADLAAAHPGLQAVPLRLPDPEMVALLEVGDRIDLVATVPEDGTASTIATGVPVLALPAPSPAATTTAAGLPGSLVVVGITREEVVAITSAALARFVTYTWSER